MDSDDRATLTKRARKLRPDDVIRADDDSEWTVAKVRPDAFGVTVDLISPTGRRFDGRRIDHPDAPATVLVPLAVRDALVLLRGELGAQLIDYERPEGEAS